MASKVHIEALVRENIRKLRPYSSARDEYSGSASVFLDANENPLSPPLNRYPDPRQSELKTRVAALKGVDAAQIFLGNGSDEAIDLLFRTCCDPGKDHAITLDPTYGMYGVCADINGVEHKSVLLNPDFSLDIRRVKQAVTDHTKLIFLCSPNNPTSNSMDRQAMLELVGSVSCLVVVDEAYVDFSEKPSLLNVLGEHPNLVVLQTFSKAWGLAGIRLGMAFAHPKLIAYLSSVKYPYNLNSLTIRHALDALDQESKTREMVAYLLNERAWLCQQLGGLSCVEQVFPSDANFLLMRVTDPGGMYHYLMDQGIIVRDRSRVPLCEGCLRVSVGSSDENKLLIQALQSYDSDQRNAQR